MREGWGGVKEGGWGGVGGAELLIFDIGGVGLGWGWDGCGSMCVGGGGHLRCAWGRREGKAEAGVDGRRPREGAGDSLPGERVRGG